ncbi:MULTISPECIES: bifunctional DNA primase/polymerase [Microbacterium]|uniref:bifunctional DNA primase/polymerase n=1 Tax=unclassified Microbacterium TaxID=2609290 RepID=UPI0010F79C9C|nr:MULTISPECIES: bifunctional DNA primase/polymerase [unclassified Microbacterium]MBN9152371.1 bifunctional DNA primase/polymerase [Microbacterium sp.]MCK9913896.1 bifunctional DNA primase/polymerase [Microbacteriaceae bacterium K1510]
MPDGDSLAVLARAGRERRLPDAALALALAGVPVFPCAPGGKTPLIRDGRGFLDATTDAAQIRAWWREAPVANIGIPTGEGSGLVVVDVDVHGPVDGTVAFARADTAGLVDGWGLLVGTPTGGLHAYFPAAPGVEQRSWQSASAGIDFRGDGGYIVAPPSIRTIDETPTRYRIVAGGSGGAPVDALRLRDFLTPPRATPPRPSAAVMRDTAVEAERLALWVSRQREGERNRSLFWAACRLAENDVPLADAREVLVTAAVQPGFEEREIVRTVDSAYRRVHAIAIRDDRADPAAPSVARQRVRARGLS